MGFASALLPLALAVPAGDDEPVTIADGHILEADLGTYWYGAPIDLRELVGRVVLWETWGS